MIPSASSSTFTAVRVVCLDISVSFCFGVWLRISKSRCLYFVFYEFILQHFIKNEVDAKEVNIDEETLPADGALLFEMAKMFMFNA